MKKLRINIFVRILSFNKKFFVYLKKLTKNLKIGLKI